MSDLEELEEVAAQGGTYKKVRDGRARNRVPWTPRRASSTAIMNRADPHRADAKLRKF